MGYWLAYELLNDKGQPAFVGIGQRGDGPMFHEPRYWPLYQFFDVNIGCPFDFVERVSGEHPAERLFRSRNSKARSEVFDWLASLDTCPPYRTIGEGSRNQVRVVQRKRRAELSRQGVTMLSGKLTKKIIRDRRPVFHVDYGSFASVRAAAKQLGYASHSYISRLCKAGAKGWSYTPESEK